MCPKIGINHTEHFVIFIDFGLSYISKTLEDKAVDLYVLEKAFQCSHPHFEDYVSHIFDGYKDSCENFDAVLKHLEKGIALSSLPSASTRKEKTSIWIIFLLFINLTPKIIHR